MRKLAFALLFTSMSAALAASAFADAPNLQPTYATSASVGAPTPKPTFALMDNTGDDSKINIEVATLIPNFFPDAVLVRPSILGQYVAPNGFGGYGVISMSSVITGGGGSGNLDFGDHQLGNLELGGLYHAVLSQHVDLGMRVGVVLPTANTASFHLFGTLLARPADLVTAIPDTTWMRLGVSPTYHRGPVFLRADLGVDVPMVDDQGLPSLGHINVGAGILHHRFSATAEMQTVFSMRGDPGKIDCDFASTAGLSARYQGTRVSPFLGISTPISRDLRGEVVTVTGGLTIPL